MNFSDFWFYPFLLLTIIVNYLLPRKVRWVWLLIVSWVFYLSIDYGFGAMLFLITVLSYGFALRIADVEQRAQKKRWRTAAVISLLLPLAGLKTLVFFAPTFSAWFSSPDSKILQFLIPLGLSFYTFSAIAYVIDVYRGTCAPQRSFARYALFISFFPKLIAGPIERGSAIMAQLFNPAPFNDDVFAQSAVRVGWGLAKKLILANRLAIFADAVFNDPGGRSAPVLIAAVLAFSFQVYIDFSAYCDIAIGTAGMLGIRLTENFKQPYFAVSVTDFWRRWHITLSTWLRDYIFLPLNFQTRRKKLVLKPRSRGRTYSAFWNDLAANAYPYRNILITFLLSGLWHGSSWNFLIWGGLHGLYQVLEQMRSHRRAEEPARRLRPILITFLLVAFAWIFFRANSISDALTITERIISLKSFFTLRGWDMGGLGLDFADRLLTFFLVVIFFVLEIVEHSTPVISIIHRQPLWRRWIFYIAGIMAIFIFGIYGGAAMGQFLYFQF